MVKSTIKLFYTGAVVFVLLIFFIDREILPESVRLLGKGTAEYNDQTIYGITSTYARLTQKADLTRLIYTLMHVPNFHWILIEDSVEKTPLVRRLLQKSGLKYTHLNKKNKKNSHHKSGVKDLLTRNAALAWVRNNVTQGVVYFMDDDNTYDLKLFEEMRTTKVASVWPVGLVGGLVVEGPVRCKNGKVLTWRVTWETNRTIPIDMAGFAINTALLRQHPDVKFVDAFDLESIFLGDLGLTRDKMEAKGNNCREVNVWHTQTAKANLYQEKVAQQLGDEYNPIIET
uniref:Galactosylgalactosylxylosylprotein 3-beta-glucuronosyltransferase n=1 Tax=Ciona intestinalis TaxID=7719 RepID=H2XX32_CIOIN|nr:galactosylgalactosylxylosylprotein 3-beta-glucuronosyltransferase sqv-8 [Ciona intestinalis]|eukprot:XP_002127079.1 galactosylgalactosylxylosylprotein 3-beta-glucuronosyltransferase sqv-8 [Ciona intestinalis]